MTVIAGATLWRVLVFDDLLPNTIRGKMWPPYAGANLTARLRSRWLGVTELLRFFIPSALLLLLWIRGSSLRSAFSAGREPLLLLAMPVAAAIAGGAVIGRNWGYVGRMPSFAAPLVLLDPSLRSARAGSLALPAPRAAGRAEQRCSSHWRR